jgi:hypothetical protein
MIRFRLDWGANLHRDWSLRPGSLGFILHRHSTPTSTYLIHSAQRNQAMSQISDLNAPYAMHACRGRGTTGTNYPFPDPDPSIRPQSTRKTGTVGCYKHSCYGSEPGIKHRAYRLANPADGRRGTTVPPSPSHPSLSPFPAPMPPVPLGGWDTSQPGRLCHARHEAKGLERQEVQGTPV